MLLAIVVLLAACSGESPTGAPDASLDPSNASAPLTPSPTPTPTPTPAPSPLFTNPPDPRLEAVIPDAVAGVKVVKPAADQYGMTPGDVGLRYGEIGARFRSLAVAYIEPRKLSLYAMTVEGDAVRTRDLEPYLATAGRYVGIAGLHREPWKLTAIGDHLIWVRPEDNATAAGTHTYTWASNHYVFLMIGTDEKINQAMLAALPGETPPSTPSPSPSSSPGASGSPKTSASAGASASQASSPSP
jgi:hypothetical protein